MMQIWLLLLIIIQMMVIFLKGYQLLKSIQLVIY